MKIDLPDCDLPDPIMLSPESAEAAENEMCCLARTIPLYEMAENVINRAVNQQRARLYSLGRDYAQMKRNSVIPQDCILPKAMNYMGQM